MIFSEKILYLNSFYSTLSYTESNRLQSICTEQKKILKELPGHFNTYSFKSISVVPPSILQIRPQTKRIEYILEWNLENPSVCILSNPFSLKLSSKCTNHVNVHKLYAVEYINTVSSLYYPFQFRFFKTVK